MKTGIVTTLIALCLPVSVFATTLRLSTDVDLLVLDGKKVSSSLLRGADSIELDNGPHQLVFRVEKTIHLSNSEERLYISLHWWLVLIPSSSTRSIFACLAWRMSGKLTILDAAPRLELLDGDATPIPVKLDILAITSTAKTIDYEVEVERYNKSAKRASLPQFATMMADDSTLLSGVSELDAIPPQSQVLTEQRLKYWFKLADPQTRNTFLQWAEKQPSS